MSTITDVCRLVATAPFSTRGVNTSLEEELSCDVHHILNFCPTVAGIYGTVVTQGCGHTVINSMASQPLSMLTTTQSRYCRSKASFMPLLGWQPARHPLAARMRRASGRSWEPVEAELADSNINIDNTCIKLVG